MIASTLAIVVVTALAGPSGYDTPLLVVERSAGKSVGAFGADVVVTCRAYEKFAVLEWNDPGLMGRRLVIRDRDEAGAAGGATKTVTAEVACAAPARPKQREVKADEGLVFSGVKGNWLFLEGADGFGMERTFAMVSLKVGSIAWGATWFMSPPPTFSGRSLDYVRPLQLICDVRKADCWKSERARLTIPDDVKLDLRTPCPGAKPDDDLQIGVPVHIDDLASPVPKFVSGAVACSVKP